MLKVIKFGAEWCHSCEAMKPMFSQMSKEFPDVEFKDIDVETEEGVELTIKYSIRNVPVIMFMKDGSEVHRINGNKGYSEIKKELLKWK